MKKVILFSLVVGLFALVSCNSDGSSESNDQARQSLASAPSPESAETAPLNNPATNPSLADVPTGPTTTIQWIEPDFDFGNITAGEVVTHVFKFKNTGSEPLIITDAKAGCGCTVPKKPTDPVAPGEEGAITVEFNSRGKSGAQNRDVTVTANTNPPRTVIKLKGQVAKAEG